MLKYMINNKFKMFKKGQKFDGKDLITGHCLLLSDG